VFEVRRGPDRQAELGMGPQEGRQARRQHDIRDQPLAGENHLPPRFAPAAAHLSRELRRLRQQRPGADKQGLARLRQSGGAPAAALEQCLAEVGLQRPDVLAHRGLLDTEPLGGRDEAASLGRGNEHFQAPEGGVQHGP
jgi:hypothetical protein